MILTINANAALDMILFIDRFTPKTDMRPEKAIVTVGGKGLDTALVLQTLGAPVQALTFIAGENGKTLTRLLQQHNISADLIWVPGETRIAHVIVEQDLHRISHITTSGYTVNREDCDGFLLKVDEHAATAKWAVLAGSLPGGAPTSFYREIIDRLHKQHVSVLIDNTGLPMLEALGASPEIVKMNQAEFLSTFKVEARDRDELIVACREQMAKYGIRTLVITRGKEGILVLTPESAYQARAPEVNEVNSAGAGDAVSASLVYRLFCGDSWSQALAWAAATSGAVVMTDGTAECYLPDILKIYPQVEVKELT